MKPRYIVSGVIAGGVVLAIALAIVAMHVSRLPLPIPRHGKVVDAVTGLPIAGARMETRWRLYDYPSMDGANSYELAATAITDATGLFVLQVPDHRRGFMNTEMHPPTITAPGYAPFTFDDASAVTYVSKDFVVIAITPVMHNRAITRPATE